MLTLISYISLLIGGLFVASICYLIVFKIKLV